jgi:hypothetical protein
MQSPCAFLELIAWTKSHGDAEMIMRAYKPEERENKGRKGKKNEDEDLLHQQDRKSNKWTEDEDLALKEFFEQFGHKPNAPQIIATLMDKNALQIRARLNKLGMFSTRGGDWSEDEDEDDEASLYVYARRLRNKAPAALDWVIDCYGLACETRDQTLQVCVQDLCVYVCARACVRMCVRACACSVQLTWRCTAGGQGTRFARGVFRSTGLRHCACGQGRVGVLDQPHHYATPGCDGLFRYLALLCLCSSWRTFRAICPPGANPFTLASTPLAPLSSRRPSFRLTDKCLLALCMIVLFRSSLLPRPFGLSRSCWKVYSGDLDSLLLTIDKGGVGKFKFADFCTLTRAVKSKKDSPCFLE